MAKALRLITESPPTVIDTLQLAKTASCNWMDGPMSDSRSEDNLEREDERVDEENHGEGLQRLVIIDSVPIVYSNSH